MHQNLAKIFEDLLNTTSSVRASIYIGYFTFKGIKETVYILLIFFTEALIVVLHQLIMHL